LEQLNWIDLSNTVNYTLISAKLQSKWLILKELVGGGGVQGVDEVGEDKRHQHQHVGDSLVYTGSCQKPSTRDTNHHQKKKSLSSWHALL
jgi:hypothetical protein